MDKDKAVRRSGSVGAVVPEVDTVSETVLDVPGFFVEVHYTFLASFGPSKEVANNGHQIVSKLLQRTVEPRVAPWPPSDTLWRVDHWEKVITDTRAPRPYIKYATPPLFGVLLQ